MSINKDLYNKDLYKNFNKDFKKYKLPKSNATMAEICMPHKFKLQPQQLFLKDF